MDIALDIHADAILDSTKKELRKRRLSKQRRQELEKMEVYFEQYKDLKMRAVEFDKYKPIHLRRITLSDDLEQKVEAAESFCRLEFIEELLGEWIHYPCDPNDELQFRRFMRYSRLENWFPDEPTLVAELRRRYARRPDENPTPREEMAEAR